MRNSALALVALATLAASGCSPTRRGDAASAKVWPGRQHRLVSWGQGAPSLLINVPEGYEPGKRDGADFDVHLFRRPPRTASPDSASLGIYVGHSPRTIRDKTLAEPGTVAGQPTTWYGSTWEKDGRTVYHAETQVEGLFKRAGVWSPRVRGLVVHLFAWGTDQAEVEALI